MLQPMRTNLIANPPSCSERLVFVWSCQQCGNEFVDAAISRVYGADRCGTPRGRVGS